LEEIVRYRQWNTGAEAQPKQSMSERSSDDKELLRQLARGNEPAFRALYGRYQGPIYRFALHMSGSRATAEDATQEAFMALIANPKGYDPAKGSVAGYLFGIARNITREAIRLCASDVLLDEDDGELDELSLASDLSVLDELSSGELIATLRKAVLGLPQQYREAVVLCDLEEMGYQEAAELLRCSPGTVASRLHRARAMLKKKLSCQKCVR
jgi:RNA polymerase sigma-70 factor (ECF subfamily)